MGKQQGAHSKYWRDVARVGAAWQTSQSKLILQTHLSYTSFAARFLFHLNF